MSTTFVKESKNKVVIKLTINETVKEYEYSYTSKEELYNADFESVLKLIEKDLSNEVEFDEECTIHVSITVSVGYDSSYASMTVSGDFPCETWKEDARKLKADAQELLGL